jgi:ACDE family multidrug resistance protein
MSQTSLYRQRNIHVIFAVTLMAVLGVSSITPAFPKIVRELGISSSQVGLLITFFTLPGIILAPFLGVLADRIGRKRILVPSLFLFAIAGTACAFIHHFHMLLLLRALQGAGAAALGALNVTIIGDLYSGTQRAEAMGLNTSVLNIGTASYPTIGGALALLGWYYPFALPVLAIPVGIFVLAALKNPEPKSTRSMREYLSGTWRYLKDIRAISLFVATLIAFVLLYGAYLTYLPILLDERFGASSFTIGVILSSMSLTTAIVASQLGRLSNRFTLSSIIKAAFIIYALALALMPFMPGIWFLVIPAIIFGLAHGAGLPAILTAVAGLAPLENRAAFMSINGAVLRLGQTIGPALMGLIYAFGGLDAPFLAAAALALLTLTIAIAFGARTKIWQV